MANLPLALALGMRTNAYFVYIVVGFHRSGLISSRTALAAVFIEGLIFLWQNLSINRSFSAGIGLFIGL
ncbi:hypothetical protein Bca4012_063042 [Brassica carinata]|uniref:Uncharacterized protein n=1 Tax=Brassica carinata TaxID=52824 RepID=A0A8X7V6I2_BRACI|nr:hypothetical protein Bca52824_032775 [Brassica carinata]